MAVLGISAFYHDSAVALVSGGRILAAAQEERFSRRKNDSSFPRLALGYALQVARNEGERIEAIAFHEKPLRKFERLLLTWMTVAPRGFKAFRVALPSWARQKLWIPLLIEEWYEEQALGPMPQLCFTEHHEAHAASAFLPSPFERAAILTVDGVGEWATSTIARGEGQRIETLCEQRFPHSLGLLYSAFTYFLGFKVNSGEYKLMGLAPYGQPRHVQRIFDELVDLRDDGSFRLNLEHLAFLDDLVMTGPGFERIFDIPRREQESEIKAVHTDIARSIQVVTEEVLLRMTRHAHALTGLDTLCMAGGVALNCVANGRILREGPFKELWIQPAAGDAGGALGAALLVSSQLDKSARVPVVPDAMGAALLGPEHDDFEIQAFIKRLRYPARELEPASWASAIASLLAQGRVVGLFQGRMEFGPRALGARSILADARSSSMQSLLNRRIKYRESFRPFAPACLEERSAEWFDLEVPSPYMLLVARLREERCKSGDSDQASSILERLAGTRSEVPAVTHVDYSARVQTVSEQQNPRFHSIIKAFEALTGCPMVVNTSFNVRGEPIVCSPCDAWNCFMRTDIDCLVMGSFLLDKRDLDSWGGAGIWPRELKEDRSP